MEGAYGSLRREAESAGNTHAAIAKQINEEAVKVLEDTAIELETQRKKISSQGFQILKQLNDTKIELEKSKERYYRLSRIAEVSEAEKGGEKKTQRLKQQAQEEEQNYINQISSFNHVQSDFYHCAMPPLLNELEELFTSRVSILRKVCITYASANAKSYLELMEPCERLRFVAGNVDAAKDTEEYVGKLVDKAETEPTACIFTPYKSVFCFYINYIFAF